MTLVFGGAVAGAAQVTILVNPGPFAGIEEAAKSEEKVNWWDADLSDDRACTECFAAMELARFLPACTELSKDDIKLSSAKKLPAGGDVFLVGSRQSNSLIAARKLPEGTELKTDESFRLQAVQEKDRTITTIEGKDRVGTLYGVYGYLEQLGIRFYGLGDKTNQRAGKSVPATILLSEYVNGRENTIKLSEPYKIPSKGAVYPGEPVELPKELNVVENPDFLTRGFWAWQDRGDEDFFLWMARNRINLWTDAEKEIHFLKKLGMKLAGGCHAITEHCIGPHNEYPYDHPKFKGDEDKPNDPYALGDEYTGDTNGDGKLSYFEAHPEWYGLRNGKRSDRMKTGYGDNYCTSNADATKELAKNLVQSFIDGRWRYVDIASLTLLDGATWCECDNCKRQGSCTDRVFDVAYTVLKEIESARRKGRLQRNIQLRITAYRDTLAPPMRPLPDDFDYQNCSVGFCPIERCYVHPFADPACTEINRRMFESYQGWTTGSGRFYTGSICINEYYNVSYLKSLPMLFTHIIAADIPWFYRTGARHFNYMHTPTRLWGTWTLNQYLFARLLWNTKTNVEATLKEYFRRYYPTTTGHTRTFYRQLETAMVNINTIKCWGWSKQLTNKNSDMFSLEHLHYDTYHPALNDGPDIVDMVDAMRRARKEIDASLMQCTDETERKRLLEDERRFAYGEAMVFFYYHLVRTAIFYHRNNDAMAKHELGYVEQFVDRLKEVTNLVHVSSSHANAKDGFEATKAVNIYNFFKKMYGD